MDPQKPQPDELPPPNIEIGSVPGKGFIALRITMFIMPDAVNAMVDAMRTVAQQASTGFIVPTLRIKSDGDKEA